MSSSPNPIISFDDLAPANIVARQALSPPTQFFHPPLSPSTHVYYFSGPAPIYFFAVNNPPLPPSIWMYYPLWVINPNPNRFEFTQECYPQYSPNPSQELSHPPTSGTGVFGCRSYGQGKEMIWRRKMKHEVDSNDDPITTVMLRNIPNRYTREMLIEYMDNHCEDMNRNVKDEQSPISAYDFLYLPVDFESEMNKGFAFVNFTNAEAVWKFKNACNHKSWFRFHSRKILEITSAKIQGKDALVRHFQNMTYPAEAYSAVCFSPARSGLNDTVQTSMVGKCTELMKSV